MAKDPDSKNGGNRFKFPPSPQGSSKIHEDLAASHHRPGLPLNGESTTMLRQIMPAGRKLHVGVVGGGVSGMRCAEVLLAHGIRVTILEARDRFGGRLGQGTLKGGYLADLGPNWIHGTENNPMVDLAKATDTITSEWGEKQIYIDSDRSIVPSGETRYAAELVWETVTEAFKDSNARFGLGAEEGIPASKSLADFFDDKIARICGAEKTPDNLAKAKLLKKASNFFGPFTGQPVEKQSLKFFWLEECLEGENLFCADSYFKILQRLSEPVKGSAEIRYNRVVESIRGRNDKLGGRFSPSLVHSKARCASSGGDETIDSETEFDEVVVTTPLGWLKQHQTAFDPPLSDRTRSAIDALGYGTLDKVYVTFSQAWWNEPMANDASVPPLGVQQHTPNVTAPTAPIHQLAPSETTSDRLLAEDPNYPGFTTFLQPQYAVDTNPTMQNQEICNLAALPGTAAQPTLLFYIYGDFGRSIADVVAAIPPRSLQGPASEQYMNSLWPYLEPYISQLPNYDPSAPGCKPVDMLATEWVNDEFAGNGSYTNFPTGLERGDEDVMVLRAGMPDRGIWFAGEHTAPFVALGTVTGAYWSGEAVARRILSAYGIEEVAGNGDGVRESTRTNGTT